MSVETANQLGLAGPTSQIITEPEPLSGEWPARPVETVEYTDRLTGITRRISWEEYLLKMGNNNRGGT